jgi:hypothetical protein
MVEPSRLEREDRISSFERSINTMRLFTPAVMTCLLLAGAARPEKPLAKEVKPTQEWGGSLEDEALQKEAPPEGLITDNKTFTKLWRGWKVGGRMPAVNFKSELALVATTSGSRLNTTARLTADGDLKVLSMATLDFLPGFRYQILIVPREGVKTVNGKPLAKGK